MKKKAPTPQPTSPVQTQSFDLAKAEGAKRDDAIATTQPAINRILTPDASGQTALRRGLTQSLQGATANSYDNVLARTRERANAAGFGGNTFGAETAIKNQQAHDIGQIPGQVEQQATETELAAIGAQQGNAAMYDPRGYYSEGAGLEGQRLDQEFQAEEARKARKGGLLRGLANVGLSTAGSYFTGGLMKPKPFNN
jgi:hypothetical protein